MTVDTIAIEFRLL